MREGENKEFPVIDPFDVESREGETEPHCWSLPLPYQECLVFFLRHKIRSLDGKNWPEFGGLLLLRQETESYLCHGKNPS